MAALSATPIHTQRKGAASTRTASQHALQERQRDRSKAMGCQHSRARDLHTVLTRRTHTHPSHQSTSTAPSQPAVWPCQMTYDTQHLRPIGGGALSNAHTHRAGGSSKHTNGIAACIARDRQIQSTGVSALEQETYVLSSPETHTPIPPIHQRSTEPAGRVAVSDDI
eukprot:COSAG06_NODE_25795_length_628_cov_2.170132_1_plen_167_part_00